MKKVLLTSMALVLSLATFAQINTNYVMRYDFSYGSLVDKSTEARHLSSSSGAINVNADRSNIANAAADLSNGSILTSTYFSDRELLNKEWTISFWMKSPNSSANTTFSFLRMFTNSPFIRNTEGMNLSLTSGPSSSLGLFNGLSGGNGSYRGLSQNINAAGLFNNQWHHVVVQAKTYNIDSLETKVFIDNQLKETYHFKFPGTIKWWTRSVNLLINGDGLYKGTLDDIRVYKSYLNTQDIALLYNETPEPPKTIYVDLNATGINDGTSWTNAYTKPGDAFTNASEGDEIWIAKGKYVASGTNRSASYLWTKDYIKVYGGFSGNGTETSVDQRNWFTNETIFSGDIGDDGDPTNNVYAVFTGPYATGSSPTLQYAYIDGIIIQDGNANSSNTSSRWGRYGGGSYLGWKTKKIEFKNCTWRNNIAVAGGGVSVDGEANEKEITFENCRFTNNRARNGAPFSFYTFSKNVNIGMVNCLIDNNVLEDQTSGTGAEGHGGTICGYNGGILLAVLRNCTWVNNKDSSTGSTGALIAAYRRFARGSAFLTVNNCLISDNESQDKNFRYNPIANNSGMSNITYQNTLVESKSGIGAGTGSASLIVANAQFMDAANNNFNLKSTSPAIDAGDSIGLWTYPTDFRGFRRLVGDNIDLGCIEYSSTTNSKKVGYIQVKLYPNPAQSTLNVIATEDITSIQIINLQGQNLMQQNTASNKIDISKLPKGLYVIKVSTMQGTITSKFIKN